MKQRIAMIAGLNLVLALAGWFLLVAPQRHHAQSAAQQLQQVQQEITRVSGLSGTQNQQVKQQVIRTGSLYRLAQAMPVTADESDLLLMLDQLARASGVKVLLLSPQTPTASIGYVTLPIQLSLQGTYGSLTRYVHRLRLLVGLRQGRLHATGRLIAVTSVAMTPATVGKGETAAVDVNAFVYGAVNGVTPASATSTDTSSTGTSTTSTTSTTGG